MAQTQTQASIGTGTEVRERITDAAEALAAYPDAEARLDAFMAGKLSREAYTASLALKPADSKAVTVTVEYLPAGSDTRGDGMFVTQTPKLSVAVTVGKAKPRLVRESFAVMSALYSDDTIARVRRMLTQHEA